jgi:hypothetical protein
MFPDWAMGMIKEGPAGSTFRNLVDKILGLQSTAPAEQKDPRVQLLREFSKSRR